MLPICAKIFMAFSLMLCLLSPCELLSQERVTIPPAPVPELRPTIATDRNSAIFYRNKLEYSEQLGVHWINIPFVFDFLLQDTYSQKPLHYTLVPVISSLRWQMGKVSGPPVLRGNTDASVAFVHTQIPRGPETHYEAFDLGFRRNFIPRNWRTTPYFDTHVGVGKIDAKGPKPYRVRYAQGQDLTFTLMMGAGLRYNFNERYSCEFGLNYMHVSNLYMSEPKVTNNGINVWGPMIGFNRSLGKLHFVRHKHQAY